MRRIAIIILTLIAGITSVCAQSKTTLLQRINEIKSQNEIYYWDQYTCPNADTAKVNATIRMLIGINIDRSDDAQLSVEDVLPYASFINIDRGSIKQCFAYIRKTHAALIGQGGSNFTTSPITEADMPDNTSTTSASTTVTPILSQPRTFVPDAFVQRIMETKNFIDVYKLLKSQKEQGQVLQFGKLRDVEDYSSFDLILFDIQSQEIITMLSSETETGSRINMVNGSEDSLNNYPTNMTAVIWYIKK